MKEHARGLVIGGVVLTLALPALYIGSEGVWYLASGQRRFSAGSSYRTVYAPLDWAGDRLPPVYEARQALANGWLRLSIADSRGAQVDPHELPWPYFGGFDDVQYFPPDNEFRRSRQAAAMLQYRVEREAATLDASGATSRPVEAEESADE
ncbi:MAG TPA: hypothetical protein VGN57_20780 [Pirellulaceae bacterium]|jgi:hypothetical protein|nr:hypothetical protein [Pirellulaceae bacterium]